MTKLTREQAADLLARLGFENVDALLDLVAPKPTTAEAMNAWIKDQASRGVPSLTTGLPGTAATPAAQRTDANAGAHSVPPIKESASKQMDRLIRRAAGRNVE